MHLDGESELMEQLGMLGAALRPKRRRSKKDLMEQLDLMEELDLMEQLGTLGAALRPKRRGSKKNLMELKAKPDLTELDLEDDFEEADFLY